ncbi:MAG: 16S rRNA (cytosine(1402)-N(4))-methyltransferase RsmH [Anaerohalosphaeraceae bacterium]|nr:16S rRNA (cytosine(1402)-N(4))-methyltransferase RsmH [Anaerohalosphaeraceae bacterium]
MPAEHIPVLAEDVKNSLVLSPDAVVVDATVGYGGHSSIFAESLGAGATLVGLDVDPKSLENAKKALANVKCNVRLFRANFAEIDDVFSAAGIEKADLIFADLGICSAQLLDPERGLSFQLDSALDMRLDDRLKVTAAEIVNSRDEKGLADLIFEFGQERASRKIARFIVHHRSRQKITTTSQLVEIICQALKVNPESRKRKIHPATKTFQALRIAVNDELGCLKTFLVRAKELLTPGGKIAVISFHSLEDGIVKHDFKESVYTGNYKIITKKPITASQSEASKNPRARSAKMRIAQKV